MSKYFVRTADAKHLTCAICGKQSDFNVRVSYRERKGSRSLGIFCTKHAEAKLSHLRSREK